MNRFADRFSGRALATISILGLLVVLAVVIQLGFTVGNNTAGDEQQGAAITRSDATIATLKQDVLANKSGLDRANRKLKANNLAPVPTPSTSSTTQGEPGSAGLNGLPGERGPQGIPGSAGSPGADGAAGRDGSDSDVPGPPGKDGRDGVDGKDGAAGADSTVPGPQGTALPGTYTCPDGDFLHGFAIDGGGAVTLDCQPIALLP